MPTLTPTPSRQHQHQHNTNTTNATTNLRLVLLLSFLLMLLLLLPLLLLPRFAGSRTLGPFGAPHGRWMANYPSTPHTFYGSRTKNNSRRRWSISRTPLDRLSTTMATAVVVVTALVVVKRKVRRPAPAILSDSRYLAKPTRATRSAAPVAPPQHVGRCV